jgi:hypothetical protein
VAQMRDFSTKSDQITVKGNKKKKKKKERREEAR